MDCSFCLMPTRAHDDDEDISWHEISKVLRNVSADDVRALQTSSIQCTARSVVGTVSRQLIVARAEISAEPNTDLLREARKYLAQVSASRWPPALASFNGLGSSPFLLYESVAFDRLHALDLGLLRELPDHAYKLFSSTGYNKGMVSRAALVRRANARFRDLPPSVHVHMQPFRSSAGEVHAGMTGKQRRLAAPFLWHSVIGLQPLEHPDDDILVQATLAINELQVVLRGINLEERRSARSEDDIRAVQETAFRAGLYVSQALGLPVNTKLHRTMHHLSDTLRRFGDARRGDSDANESMHKQTKSAYDGTNHHAHQLGPQLLSLRCASMQDTLLSSLPVISETEQPSLRLQLAQVLLPRPMSSTPIVLRNETMGVPGNTARHHIVLMRLATAVHDASVEDCMDIALSITDELTLRRIWRRVLKVMFTGRFEWLSVERAATTDLRQIAYAGSDIHGCGSRFDAVEYNHDGRVLRGFIHAILCGDAFGSSLTAVIIRRLRVVEPDAANRKVVEEYRHIRLAFDEDDDPDGDVCLDVDKLPAMRRVIVVVHDMFDLVQRLGPDIRVGDLNDDSNERRFARFFQVKGVQSTTFV